MKEIFAFFSNSIQGKANGWLNKCTRLITRRRRRQSLSWRLPTIHLRSFIWIRFDFIVGNYLIEYLKRFDNLINSASTPRSIYSLPILFNLSESLPFFSLSSFNTKINFLFKQNHTKIKKNMKKIVKNMAPLCI